MNCGGSLMLLSLGSWKIWWGRIKPIGQDSDLRPPVGICWSRMAVFVQVFCFAKDFFSLHFCMLVVGWFDNGFCTTHLVDIVDSWEWYPFTVSPYVLFGHLDVI